jgi:DUF2934 family protein
MDGDEEKIRQRAYELWEQSGKPKVQRWTSGFRQSERSHKVIILLLRPKTGWNRLATLNSAFH